MSNNIFNKTALENIGTPEQLDQQIRIMKPAIWVLFIAIITAFITAIIWSFAGHITNKTAVSGIIFPKSEVQKTTIKADGVIEEVMVSEDEYVKVGSIIAIVPDEQTLNQISLLEYEKKRSNVKEKKTIEKKVEKLQELYMKNSIIKSQAEGYIQSIKGINSKVEKGENIATIIPYDKSSDENEVVVYVPLEIADTLELGMEAQISPGYIPREEYGYMEGTISSVSNTPITEERILRKMGTMNYVKDIMPEQTSVEVRIKITRDDTSYSTFKWSNVKGNEIKINIGTVCDILIITEEQRPIDLLLNR